MSYRMRPCVPIGLGATPDVGLFLVQTKEPNIWREVFIPLDCLESSVALVIPDSVPKTPMAALSQWQDREVLVSTTEYSIQTELVGLTDQEKAVLFAALSSPPMTPKELDSLFRLLGFSTYSVTRGLGDCLPAHTFPLRKKRGVHHSYFLFQVARGKQREARSHEISAKTVSKTLSLVRERIGTEELSLPEVSSTEGCYPMVRALIGCGLRTQVLQNLKPLCGHEGPWSRTLVQLALTDE